MSELPEAAVRRARAQDVPVLVELRSDMFESMGVRERDSGWREQARRWFLERIEDPSYRIVVIDLAGTVVGCAMGAIRDAAPSPAVPGGRDVLISNVCVLPSHRRHGHGRAVFAAVLDWARASGVGRAELLATSAGSELYRDAGFTDSEHPVMRAALTPPGRDDG